MDVLSDDPTYATFLAEYLLANRPVLIRSSVVTGWPACVDWTLDVLDDKTTTYTEQEKRENLHKLGQLFGQLIVGVAKQTVHSLTDPQNFVASAVDWPNHIVNQDCDSCKFNDVIAAWLNKQQRVHDGKKPENHTNQAALESQVMYIRDWHLIRTWEERMKQENDEEQDGRKTTPFYRVPDYCLDDWMNDYYSAETDADFRFVYMGERGTMTQLHTDVYKSYSWSANVVGKKLWRLVNPENNETLTIEQSSGELIFVPSGWKHEVLNLSPIVISINHNWCNSVNLLSVYQALAQDVADVERSIADVRSLIRNKWEKQSESSLISSENGAASTWQLEWIEVVQELTKQHSGWNWMTFWGMVRFITRRDFSHLSSSVSPYATRPSSPSLKFVKDQISLCVVDFKIRDEFKFQLKLAEIIQEIECLLSALV